MNRLVLDLSTAGGVTVALLPEIVLTGWALVLMTVAAWRHRDERDLRLAGHLALAGLVSALLAVLWLWTRNAEVDGVALMIAVDDFRWATAVIFLVGAIATVLLSLGYVGRERLWIPEYYVLLMFATVGTMLMGGAADLIMLFLGLETMSIAVYVLAGIRRRSAYSAEAALKYFLLGAFASGFLLYGIALLYGATGTTNLTFLGFQLLEADIAATPMFTIGVGLLLVGLGFKVAAVPFHMWTPDVYDGAPTPVTGFMAAAVKAAGFAALIRVATFGLGDAVGVWQDAVWWLAAVTMIAGNLIALAQRHLKRMLAYSSIGHAGYLLVAAAVGTPAGGAAFLFYALAYTLMTIGAFAVLAALGRNGERDVLIDDLSGLASRRPWVALAMAIFMLSLLGFPGTAGFIGKWTILRAAVEADLHLLAVVLVGASVVSAGYYLPVIMNMYMKPLEGDRAVETEARLDLATEGRWVVGVCAGVLLLFGVWPNRALDVAERGGQDLVPQRMVITQQLDE